MPVSVGIFTDDRELSEIIQLILLRSQGLQAEVLQGPLPEANLTFRQCMIVDWAQLNRTSRHCLLRWERESTGILVDISGMLTPGCQRKIFSPPFAWTGFCADIHMPGAEGLCASPGLL
jgi:hypothetical protein